ncbi:MAG: TIGR00730 family Rossman fold protein [Alphaproteobacteria bacterium]|nr:TIGR00730 family Rossman fold protein [Alphaproteobacteria bacterium]
MHSSIGSVCVYCGSSFGTRPAFTEAARQLGTLLGQADIRLVYGGGAVGLMGVVSQAVLDAGGRVTGIIPHFLDQSEVGKMIRTDTMHDRKARMAEMSDGFVVLPGGLGTLDETFEILTWKQLNLHTKPIVLLNSEGYWDHFVHLVEHQVREGFVKEHYLKLFRIVDHVEDVLPALMESAAQARTGNDRLDRA